MPQPEAKEPQPEAKEEADQQKSQSAEPAGELPQLCTLYSTNLHYPILRSLVV